MRVPAKALALAGLLMAVPGARPALPAEPEPVPRLLAAAAEAFDNRRYVEADSLAGHAIGLLEARARPDSLQLAKACVTLSRARAARRVLADSVAVRSARRALSLLDPASPEHVLVRADAHDVLALILDEQNRSDLAVDHARRSLALRRARLGDRDEEVSEAWYRLGYIQGSLGQADSALATLRAGLEVRRRLGIARDRRVGDFHAEIAELLEREGDLEGARAEIDSCLREYETRVGPTHHAMCQGLTRACIFAYRGGDIALAADLAQRAIAIAEASPTFSPANLASLRGNLAVALAELGDYARSARVLAQVLPVYELNLGADHPQTLWAQVLLANSEAAAGDSAAATARYREVCRRFEAAANPTSTGSLTQARAGLAGLLQEIDPRQALALAEAAEAAERTRPDLNGATLVDLEALQLQLRARLGDAAGADALAARIEADLDTHGLRGRKAEANALAARAQGATRLGRHAEAVRLASEGSRIARAILVRNVRALPDRQALTLVATRSAPLDALIAAATAPGADGADAAWDELVRWRGLVAAEVAQRRPPRGAGVDAAVLAAHAAWTEARARLARHEVRAAEAPDAATRARLAELRAAVDDAERRWAALAPRARAQDPGGIGLAQARAALPADAALVAFTVVRRPGERERLLAFAATARGPVRVVDLGESAVLADGLERWRALAGRAPKGAPGAEAVCREAGRALRARTWDAIAPVIEGRRDVFVVGEGPLLGLPWGALPDGDTGYLVEREVRVHSLFAERDLAGTAPPPAAGGLLAVGGVDFAGDEGGGAAATARPILIAASTRAVLGDCVASLPERFPPLPGTDDEVRAIAREWGREAQVLRGTAATEAAFKALAPGRRVLHLATHAILLADACSEAAPGTRGVGGLAPLDDAPPPARPAGIPPSPWLGRRVFLALSGADRARERDRDENEGLLTAEEVAGLDLEGTEWVVLSACESGVAEAWSREGLLGLTRAFRLAGARVVIASQWAVDDETTREWMTALYGARHDGALTTAEAMQQASREVLRARRADGRGTHPFHWAAFTAAGD